MKKKFVEAVGKLGDDGAYFIRSCENGDERPKAYPSTATLTIFAGVRDKSSQVPTREMKRTWTQMPAALPNRIQPWKRGPTTSSIAR